MNRLPSETQSPFGLVAWLESTKITLPLKGVECRFDAIAGVVSVEIDQVFHQDGERPLDCTYSFPLPAGAAVHRCEMQVNERVIRAKVEASDDAARIYREQKEAGRRAMLVQTERKNLFTLALGNVQPGDVIVVRFAYFQTLDRIADGLSVRIPVCPGVRYIPGKPLLRSLSGRGSSDDTDQVPDASRISPPRIDALHPDAAYFAVSGRIAASEVAADTLSSPTHLVSVRDGETSLDLALAEGGAVPDRDFILRWTEPKQAALTPHAWSYRSCGETFALVQFRAPADVPVVADFPQDVYFLVDRSGSMAGAKWEKSCEALRAFVELLGTGDRVWITLFESSFQDFAEKPLPVAKIRGDATFQNLVAHGTAGGTDLLPAAEHVLTKIGEHSKARRSVLIVITDGQVGNDQAIVQRFRASGQTTVFTFGIDTAVNDAFLRDLAAQTGGECWLQCPNDDIVGTVAKLGARLRRPVLVDLRVAAGWEVPSPRMPDVFGGQRIDFSLRHTGPAPRTIEIAGRLGSGEERTFRLPLAEVKNEAVKLVWARQRIAALLVAGDSSAAVALAKTCNLICEGAAFVAWDEAEQVPVATEEIYQPSLMAEMMQRSGGEHMMLCESFGYEMFARGVDHEDHCWGSVQPTDHAWKRRTVLRICQALGIKRGIAGILVQWILADPEDRLARQDLFVEFASKLCDNSPEVADLVRACREFFDLHFSATPELLEKAHRSLDAWQAKQPA